MTAAMVAPAIPLIACLQLHVLAHGATNALYMGSMPAAMLALSCSTAEAVLGEDVGEAPALFMAMGTFGRVEPVAKERGEERWPRPFNCS